MIGVFMLLSALFSAVETAFFSLEPAQIRRLKVDRPAVAAQLEKLLGTNVRALLGALLLADVCTTIPLMILCLAFMRDVEQFGLPFFAGTLLIFVIVVILCELIPKLIALRTPMRVATLGTRVVDRLMPFSEPFCRFLQNESDRVARWLAPDSLRKVMPLDEGELETLIRIGLEEGALQATESEIIQELLKLDSSTAGDCMLPRIDMFAIPDDLDEGELLPLLRSKRFRQVPVYAETPDEILGVLDVTRFLLMPEGTHYTEALTPPNYVPETMKALDLLRGFLRHPKRLAIVVDEFGGTEGIVTLADMIEQILSDALPSADHELYIENFGAGRLIVAGSARLDDLGERLNITFEEEGIDTIGGLLFNRLGAIPKPGEVITLHGLRITVRRASRKRIHELLIDPPSGAGRGEEGMDEEVDLP
ncbi:MAG TPA: hemolysin family protein [Chthoniobacteraceae bacterium]|nr:hemolysin family protein [Chthoniobacteraceae bacterium]